ncbi:TPA: hypothetical protein ACF9RR_000471 [Streptococcus pyogenes]|nr:hypothetical protein [Streptococcus pyogenes]HER5498584.1 hypothetical protein [Streptococcus pyogenes]HER5505287.1 hypothetical protein [Streptococcus pyogenes]HER5508895.1 hypothetical protein [Streptococcus pyogenes]
MKTKSKRFLNLATLCLALLGTTLLTTQPAEAEVILLPINGNGSGGLNSQAEDDLKVDWYKGHKDGLKKGEAASKREDLVREKIPVPQGVLDKTEYWDGYETGYSEGWYNKHGLDESNDSDTDSSQNKNSQEEKEPAAPSQDDRGHHGSVDSRPQQEDTDIIFPIVETVIQAVLGVLSSFLSWLAN